MNQKDVKWNYAMGYNPKPIESREDVVVLMKLVLSELAKINKLLEEAFTKMAEEVERELREKHVEKETQRIRKLIEEEKRQKEDHRQWDIHKEWKEWQETWLKASSPSLPPTNCS